MQYNKDYKSIMQKKPLELLNWLLSEFSVQIPEAVVTADDIKKASEILLQLSNTYSYLVTLTSYAKLATREAKRNLPKEEYEDMVDRRDVLQNFSDITKQSYAAVSRAVTIYIENNNELRMSRGSI